MFLFVCCSPFLLNPDLVDGCVSGVEEVLAVVFSCRLLVVQKVFVIQESVTQL